MKYNYGAATGLPISNNLSVGMTLCEELHLVGFGCPAEDECNYEQDGYCPMEERQDRGPR